MASPCFFVVDEFQKREIDVDGDGVADLSHGEVIELVIQSRAPGVKINRMELPLGVFRGAGLNHLDKYFREILQFLDQGGKCAGVNLSLSSGVRFIDARINNDRTTPENIFQRRDAVKSHLASWYNERKLGPWKEAIEAIEVVAKRCPVYVGAGNDGNQKLNSLTLADGVHNVGAVDAQGVKTYFTPTHSLIHRFARGVLAVHKVAGGYDLTGSGRAEVLDQQVSGGKSKLEYFTDKPLSETLMPEAQFNLIYKQLMEQGGTSLKNRHDFNDRLLSAEQMVRLGLLTGQYADKPLYGYVAGGELKGLFKADIAGRVVYDPDNSGRSGAVNEINGTSFAAPWAMTDDYVRSMSS